MLRPRSVAVIGASRDPEKVGNVILQNYINSGYGGKLFPVNRNADAIMGMKAYAKASDIRQKIDLAVVAVPAQAVPEVLEDCGKAGVRSTIVVSGGFAEVGATALQERIVQISEKYGMPMLGPNCLGVMDTRSRVDTLFLPTYKMVRPQIGSVSFICQSGAVGSTILDTISKEGFGLSKFISYGNAAMVDETDILGYLAADEDTKAILMYIEGVTRGREFMKTAREAARRKPVIVIKGGVTDQGALAAHSHTAALAGSSEVYSAVFRQAGLSEAKDISDLLNFAKAFDAEPLPRGNRVAVITNGGGMGVLATDELYMHGLQLSEFSEESKAVLRASLSQIIAIKNPLDLLGDADDRRYETALSALSKDPNVDIIVAIALFQTPGADSKVAATLIHYKKNIDMPMIVISLGSDYTAVHKMMMESSSLPVYDSPRAAAASLAELLNRARYLEREKDTGKDRIQSHVLRRPS
jgi:acetyl coenzyme A synthetase (ADP forming)-like protein